MVEPAHPTPAALERLNALSREDARDVLGRCCGANRWVEAMLARRPFASASVLLAEADAIWRTLGREDFLQAFSHHPEIGADPAQLRREFAATAALSTAEQAGAAGAGEATLLALREGNQRYRERFGHVFIVCATGKSAEEMLALLQARLHNTSEVELAIAAEEQRKITRLRLEKLDG